MSFSNSIRNVFIGFNPFDIMFAISPDYWVGEEDPPTEQEFLESAAIGDTHVAERALKSLDLSVQSTAGMNLKRVGKGPSIQKEWGPYYIAGSFKYDLTQSSPLGHRALKIACVYDQERIVDLFLKYQHVAMDVLSQQDCHRATVLHHVVELPHASKYIAKLLLAGAPPNTQNIGWNTPLDLTVSSIGGEHYKSAKIILKCYLDFKAKVKSELLDKARIPAPLCDIVLGYKGCLHDSDKLSTLLNNVFEPRNGNTLSEEEHEIALLLMENGADPRLFVSLCKKELLNTHIRFNLFSPDLKEKVLSKAKELDDADKVTREAHEVYSEKTRSLEADQEKEIHFVNHILEYMDLCTDLRKVDHADLRYYDTLLFEFENIFSGKALL